MSKHTPGPWHLFEDAGFINEVYADVNGRRFEIVERVGGNVFRDQYGHFTDYSERRANARLIAAAPTQHEEMKRYLPIIERAEADAELWARLTKGTGIATANAYRAAIAKAEGGQDE